MHCKGNKSIGWAHSEWCDGGRLPPSRYLLSGLSFTIDTVQLLAVHVGPLSRHQLVVSEYVCLRQFVVIYRHFPNRAFKEGL